MKIKNILVLIILLNLIGCAHMIKRTYNLPKGQERADDFSPKIVYKKNLSGLNAEYLGSIKLDDSGFSVNCSKEKAFDILINDACLLNANLINIIEYAEPGASTCYRCIADFYNFDFTELNTKILENDSRIIIPYSRYSNFKWSDLKVNIPENSENDYSIVSNLYLSSSTDIWFGKYKNFESNAVIFADISGVKESFKSNNNLEHIKLIFDISQIYSKKLENHLNNEISKTGRKDKIQAIINDYHKKMNTEIQKYSLETEFGQKQAKQNQWDKKISELKEEFRINSTINDSLEATTDMYSYILEFHLESSDTVKGYIIRTESDKVFVEKERNLYIINSDKIGSITLNGSNISKDFINKNYGKRINYNNYIEIKKFD